MTGFGSQVGSNTGGGSLGSDVTVSGHANPYFSEGIFDLSNGNITEVFELVSTNNNFRLTGIFVTVSAAVRVRVLINDIEIRRYETSPVDRNAKIVFTEHRPLLSGQKLEITVELFSFYAYYSPYSGLYSVEGYIKPT